MLDGLRHLFPLAPLTFTDLRLRAAIVDQLAFDGTIIETGTDSYRLASPAHEPKSRPMAG
ncbi:hypothetical protein [Streptomyces venezuelae]|uniref:hypothetical protein n=1 Tax=Streptomyces venezuelae TaxID=54571 RepID=UPI000903D965|nr:hypothetical protein [Streptomyces venezuelae]APE26804.1 hypothetical protein vnz_37520 [Streptomyces venezuelae]